MDTAEHEILILVAAMIAQGRPHFSEANIKTMVKLAAKSRREIYVAAQAELSTTAPPMTAPPINEAAEAKLRSELAAFEPQ
ncbi:MAG TPA: hypothetical protein VKQ11_00380 [Candidatus Sulfotelmatobacter sp.]|nr:hypothetical protein [Candidatus Sulfotelmatobacter sp.]